MGPQEEKRGCALIRGCATNRENTVPSNCNLFSWLVALLLFVMSSFDFQLKTEIAAYNLVVSCTVCGEFLQYCIFSP